MLLRLFAWSVIYAVVCKKTLHGIKTYKVICIQIVYLPPRCNLHLYSFDTDEKLIEFVDYSEQVDIFRPAIFTRRA